MIWHDNDEVRQILCSMKSDPPGTERYTAPSDSSRGNKSYIRYVGKRVNRLNEIRNSVLDSALTLCDAIGDHSLFKQLVNQDDVEQLIAGSLNR